MNSMTCNRRCLCREHLDGTGYSGTAFVAGALQVQLHMDKVIGLNVDDVMILPYGMYGTQIVI